MAKNNDSKRNPSAPSRVYKSSDVHKRRVNRKDRKKPAEAPREVKTPVVRQAPPEGQSSKSAVVLSPQFGAKSEAQRAADERWFAAMREQAPESEALAGEEVGAFESTEQQVASPAATNALAEQGSPATQSDIPFNQRPTERIDSRATEAAVKAQEAGETAGVSADATTAMPVVPPISAADTEQAAEEKPESTAAKFRKRVSSAIPSSRKMRIALAAGSLALVLAIVFVSLFAWNRWYRFNDRADMQGEWYVVGSTVPVTIDETSIHLTDDVTYQYEINDHDKTISYTFGPMSGQGRYWFSDDRKYLVITDGDNFTGENTAFEDLLHMFGDLPDKVSGSNIKLPEGEGIIAFSREPDPAAVAKKQEEEKAKAEAEEAARKEEERRAAEEAAEAEAYYYYEEEVVEEAPAETPPAEEAPAEEPPAEESGGQE